ncbi:MAG: hypothetical protein LUC24_00150 [Bacteroidales bacterium]|nr:hypothetical protein [Bacteroidales bacterium]
MKNLTKSLGQPEARTNKDNSAPFLFSSSLICVDENGRSVSVDTSEDDRNAVFSQNYKYWNRETAFSSANNFDNRYFMEIVNMGRDAVPYIVAEIKRKPSQLVHALDLIFPGVMKYNGFVSLKEACDRWLTILVK